MRRTRPFAEQAQYPISEPDGRLVRVRGKGVIIAEIAHSLRGGFAELGAAIPDIDAPQAGAAIDQVPPVPVPDPNPGAAGDDRRTVLQVIGYRGRRMQQALP